MRRIDVPLHDCEVCRRTVPRRRYASGRLERPQKYEAKRTCGRTPCIIERGNRTKVETHRFVRGNPDVPKLEAIARENRLSVGHCARCSDVFVMTQAEELRGRKRCDYCRRYTAGGTVSFLRGSNRTSEARYMAALERIHSQAEAFV